MFLHVHSFLLFVFEVETRKGRTWANFGEGAGIPGQQTDEEDWETGARDTVQTEHPGAGKEDQPLQHASLILSCWLISYPNIWLSYELLIHLQNNIMACQTLNDCRNR